MNFYKYVLRNIITNNLIRFREITMYINFPMWKGHGKIPVDA